MTDILVYDNEETISSKFYLTMKRFYPHFESQAFQKKWIVAIPLSKSFDSDKMTKQFINSHIFQPSSFYLGQYVSLTGKQAEIKSSFLLISKKMGNEANPQIERSCRILEDNEVYNEHISSQSYRILLIDKPVEGHYHAINPSQTGIAALHKKSIDEIMNYILNDPASTQVSSSLKRDIHYLVTGYKVNSDVDCIDDLYHRIDHMINAHYEMMIKTNPAWSCCQQSHEKEMILRCCIETFIMEQIYSFLYPLIQKRYTEEDSILRKYLTFIKNNGGFTREDLAVKPLFFQPSCLQSATRILNQLNTTRCVLRKLRVIWECLKNINLSVSDYVQSHYGQTIDLVADDIVPLTVFVISNSDITNLISVMEYINRFDFTELKDKDLGFCFVTFQVAVSFLKDKSIEWNRNHTIQNPTIPLLFLTSQQKSFIRRESKDQQLRRGTISFNPQQMTYRNENSVVLNRQTGQTDSVFSQILIRDYFNEETVSPDLPEISLHTQSSEHSPVENESYWWNSHALKKKRLVLPWNYSETPSSSPHSSRKTSKPSSPRFLGKRPSSPHSFKPSSPRLFSPSIATPSVKQCLIEFPEPVQKKKHRFCCCGSEEVNEENEPTSVLNSSTKEEPPIQIDYPVKRTNGPPGRIKGISSTLPLQTERKSSDCNEINRSDPVSSSKINSLSLFPFVDSSVDDDETRKDVTSSLDSGMGSFIQDLKKSSGHFVSSRSWNVSD